MGVRFFLSLLGMQKESLLQWDVTSKSTETAQQQRASTAFFQLNLCTGHWFAMFEAFRLSQESFPCPPRGHFFQCFLMLARSCCSGRCGFHKFIDLHCFIAILAAMGHANSSGSDKAAECVPSIELGMRHGSFTCADDYCNSWLVVYLPSEKYEFVS